MLRLQRLQSKQFVTSLLCMPPLSEAEIDLAPQEDQVIHHPAEIQSAQSPCQFVSVPPQQPVSKTNAPLNGFLVYHRLLMNPPVRLGKMQSKFLSASPH